MRSSIQSSENAGFNEILDDWKQGWFKDREPKAKFWEGTSFQLQKAFGYDESAKEFVRKFSVDSIGRHLAGLMNKGAHIECDDSGRTRKWKIYRDDTETGFEQKAQAVSCT